MLIAKKKHLSNFNSNYPVQLPFLSSKSLTVYSLRRRFTFRRVLAEHYYSCSNQLIRNMIILSMKSFFLHHFVNLASVKFLEIFNEANRMRTVCHSHFGLLVVFLKIFLGWGKVCFKGNIMQKMNFIIDQYVHCSLRLHLYKVKKYKYQIYTYFCKGFR